ncbi:MAG: MATE family efflux transporter [Bacteroidales bacterium]|nr:MATE family efflux transporter [Bacteroidales bacterium]
MDNNHSSHTEKRLATDKVGSLIARYSIPNTIAFVFFSIQAIVDGIIVGNYLGADALASVSLILPAYMLPSGIANILAVGAQAQMSIAMGEQNYVRAKTALKTGSISIVVYALIIFSIFNLFPVQLAGIMGAEGDLLAGSLNYIHGLMPFVGVNLIMFFLNSILKTLGHPRFAMNVIIMSILLNIVLSILFVTQFDLGTFGVGLATGVSISVGCLLSLFVVFKSLRSHPTLKKIRGKFSWHSLGRMFYNGSSEGLTEIAMNVTVMLFNLTFLKYAGKEGVAAFAVTNYIIFIGTSILLGISDGAIPVISFNYGANLWQRVRQSLKVVLRTNFIIGVVFLVFLWSLGEYALSIFLDDSSQDVIDMAVHGSRIMGFAFLLNGFNISSASFFTALDNAKWSLVISACRGLIFIVIGITILPLIFGTNGIWMTVAVAELFTAVISFALLRRHMEK